MVSPRSTSCLSDRALTDAAIRSAESLRNTYATALAITVAAIVYWHPVVMGVVLGINAVCWGMSVAVLYADLRDLKRRPVDSDPEPEEAPHEVVTTKHQA